jgi:hypothetical protein
VAALLGDLEALVHALCRERGGAVNGY